MPTSATDALGRTVTLNQLPQRIVSLVPSITEMVAALGKSSSLVGVTKFCVEPAATTDAIRKVGGTKDPDLDAILALQPDLILANVEENRREDVETLINSGVPVFVGYPRTVAQAFDELAALTGLITGLLDGGRLVLRGREALARQTRLNEIRPRVRVFCPIWRNPYLAVGGDTYAGDVIRQVGGTNIFESHGSGSRYPQVTLAEIRAADPEIILLPDEPYRFRERHRAELMVQREITAVRTGQVFLVDGRWLTWYGPRIADGLLGLEKLLDKARPGWTVPENERPEAAPQKPAPPPPNATKSTPSSPARKPPSARKPSRAAGQATPPLPPGLRFKVDTPDIVDEGG